MREGDSTEEEEKKYAFGIYRILDSEKCNENLTKKYTPLKVKDGITGNLFVNKESDSPAWKEFVTDLSSTNTHNMTNTRWSFVFLYDVDANSYAFTGGSGHHEIKEFVDQTFGMELACRLIFPDTVKLIKQKSLVGELQQESKIYREYNYNFDVTNWQKITSNLVGEADKTDLEELFGKAVDSNRLVVEGGSFIKLKHALSMTELDKVLKRVSALMKKPPRLDLFKGFSPIHKENSKHLRKILLRELRAYFADYKKRKPSNSRIFLSYEDLNEFFLSETKTIILDNYSTNFEDLDIENSLFLFLQLHNKEIHNNSLDNIHIALYDSEGEELKRKKLFNCLKCEIDIKNKKYFFIDGHWYALHGSFIDEIEKKFEDSASNCGKQSILTPWQRGKNGFLVEEGNYITTHSKMKDVVIAHNTHIHPPTSRNKYSKSELCDIIFKANGRLELIFIKKTIGEKLTQLFAQTRRSAELLKNDLDFQEEVLKKFNQLKREEITSRNIDVIIAFVDKLKRTSPLKERFTTLAKLDFLHTATFIDNLGYKFYWCEIPS